MNLFPAFDRLGRLDVGKFLTRLVTTMVDGYRLTDVAGEDGPDDDYPWGSIDLEDEFHCQHAGANAELWAALDNEAKADIINWYDDLNAMGRLGDVQFYDQWIAIRRKAA